MIRRFKFLNSSINWIIKYFEWVSAGFFSVVLAILAGLITDPSLACQLSQELLKLAIGADAALLGMVLAGLAIATSIARPEFVQWLIENDLYDSLIMPFGVASGLWATHLVLSVFTYIASHIFAVSKAGFVFAILVHGYIFGFALAVTVGLIVLIVRLSKRQAHFDRIFSNTH